MIETNEVKSEKPEQVFKEGTEEKIKKEKLVEESAKSKKSYFNYKRLSVFLIIGLLLVVGIYYVCDKLQDSTSGKQQTEATKEETEAEALPLDGEVAHEENEEDIEEEEENEEELLEREEGMEGELPEGERGEEEEEEWSYEPGPNDYLFEKVGSEMIIESVRIRLNKVEASTPKDFVFLEVGEALREKIGVGETRIIEGLSITLLEAHPEETHLESYALLRVEKP